MAFVRGKGPRLYDVDGREYSRLRVGHRRRIARPRASGSRRGDRRIRRRRCCTRRTSTTTRFRPKRPDALAALSGLAAHVLLQQRHGGQRGVPEVRAALLAHAGRDAIASASSPSSTRSAAGRWARCRSPTTSTIARRSMPLLGPVTFVNPRIAGCARRPRSPIARPPSSPSRFAARAASAAAAGVLRRDHGCLPEDRHAADRRRGADGSRAHRLSVLLAGARLGAGPRSRSARRSAPACPSARRSSPNEVAATISRRRSRQHVRRQPARPRARQSFFLEQLMDHGLLDHVRTVGAHSRAPACARSR